MLGCAAVHLDQRHEPAFAKERAMQARGPRPGRGSAPTRTCGPVDLPPRRPPGNAQLDEARAIVRLRFQWRSRIARNRRRMWASILRIICISSTEAIPKNPCQPRSHALIRAMQHTACLPSFAA